MRINCDYVNCTDKCKHYHVCPLHQPSNSSLSMLRNELNWKVGRLNEINQGISHFRNMSYQFEMGILPTEIAWHTSKEKINNKINELYLEKKELIQSIRECQLKEKNIVKILERRDTK